jgi:hypothetical protein
VQFGLSTSINRADRRGQFVVSCVLYVDLPTHKVNVFNSISRFPFRLSPLTYFFRHRTTQIYTDKFYYEPHVFPSFPAFGLSPLTFLSHLPIFSTSQLLNFYPSLRSRLTFSTSHLPNLLSLCPLPHAFSSTRLLIQRTRIDTDEHGWLLSVFAFSSLVLRPSSFIALPSTPHALCPMPPAFSPLPSVFLFQHFPFLELAVG